MTQDDMVSNDINEANWGGMEMNLFSNTPIEEEEIS